MLKQIIKSWNKKTYIWNRCLEATRSHAAPMRLDVTGTSTLHCSTVNPPEADGANQVFLLIYIRVILDRFWSDKLYSCFYWAHYAMAKFS